MRTCDDCGVGNRGAVIVQVDVDRELCEDCRPAGECERCGRETEETTLDGSFQCQHCQEKKRGENRTRDADQPGLGEWSA